MYILILYVLLYFLYSILFCALYLNSFIIFQGLDWGEDAMLSQVLAASQQEYLDSPKEKEKKEDNEKNEEMEISENKEVVVITSEAKEEQNSEQGPSASSAQS